MSGNFLIITSVILCVILVGFELYQDIVVKHPWHWSELADIARMVLVLLIASIPVAMPTVMTVTNSLGAQGLARKKAIVSRLEAIEELAGVDTLCSDKTGTLTKNMLSLGDPILFAAKTADELILAGALASEKGSEDAIDKVVSEGVKEPRTLDSYRVNKFVPFLSKCHFAPDRKISWTAKSGYWMVSFWTCCHGQMMRYLPFTPLDSTMVGASPRRVLCCDLFACVPPRFHLFMKANYRVSRPIPFKILLLLSVATLLLSACDSFRQCPGGNCPSDEEVLLQAGAVRLTPEQVRARNVGNTEEWLRGGAYYREDGTMRARWRKVFYNGTWELKDDGTLCYQLPRWQSRCHFYMGIDGDVYLLDEGWNIGVSLTFPGDQLRNIGSRKPHRDNRTR